VLSADERENEVRAGYIEGVAEAQPSVFAFIRMHRRKRKRWR
jgi:hypothetical protein